MLSPRDAAVLRRALAVGVDALIRLNGGAPAEAVRLLGEVSDAAARFRPDLSRLDGGSGTETVPPQGNPASLAGSDAEWLTTTQAAAKAKVSEGYMRRCCREGTVLAKPSARGAWLVDTRQFAAWLDDRERGSVSA